ncbi:TPA: hypothetical protein N0F65_000983 [Lagenidium giganteum]|uniref:Secreted protein n=1 Tax=Lagenidium giganteum TaxID=4803 RepID=A0AAV2YUW9_9STRA|nr:TPA: hypothetical protein N0F65_000983 [Lagenidium giganteum]
MPKSATLRGIIACTADSMSAFILPIVLPSAACEKPVQHQSPNTLPASPCCGACVNCSTCPAPTTALYGGYGHGFLLSPTSIRIPRNTRMCRQIRHSLSRRHLFG